MVMLGMGVVWGVLEAFVQKRATATHQSLELRRWHLEQQPGWPQQLSWSLMGLLTSWLLLGEIVKLASLQPFAFCGRRGL